MVGDVIAVAGEEFHPSELSSVQDVGFGEVFEVPMVSDDFHWDFGSLEPVSPVLEGPYDS
jgi:hypothetical protein